MKIGVLSDTHKHGVKRRFIETLRDAFSGVEKVLHCGDYVDPAVFEALCGESWEFIGVPGNMDDRSIQRNLPTSRQIRLGDINVGLIHGWGPPQGLEHRVAREFDGVDGVIFGHSHIPYWGHVGALWLFNPGAACGWDANNGGTVGILHVDHEVTGDVIPLKG